MPALAPARIALISTAQAGGGGGSSDVYVGTTNVVTLYVGTTAVSEMYVGTTLVFQA